MISMFQVDAFTTEAFKGNPAGVCLLTDEPSASWMQAIAREMNVSETVFIRRVESDSCETYGPLCEIEGSGAKKNGASSCDRP